MFFALVMPIVLLPVAAYAIDAAVTAEGFARLQEITVRAAEEGAQRIDAGRLRSAGQVVVDAAAAEESAGAVVEGAGAELVRVVVSGNQVTVEARQALELPLNFLGAPDVVLRAVASARLATGYESSSSLLPLPTRTF